MIRWNQSKIITRVSPYHEAGTLSGSFYGCQFEVLITTLRTLSLISLTTSVWFLIISAFCSSSSLFLSSDSAILFFSCLSESDMELRSTPRYLDTQTGVQGALDLWVVVLAVGL